MEGTLLENRTGFHHHYSAAVLADVGFRTLIINADYSGEELVHFKYVQ